MTLTPEGLDITKRFFLALDTLKTQKVIRGLQTFTRAHEINRWNLISVRNNPENKFLKPEWIYFLCTDYNISADWVITGRGSMYNGALRKSTPKKQSKQPTLPLTD